MKRKGWNYIPATNEKKIKIHLTVLTFRTSDGKYVSIKDLPLKTFIQAVDFFDALMNLERKFEARILGDDESGSAGFNMDEFIFWWEPGCEDELYVSCHNHPVGKIVRERKTA